MYGSGFRDSVPALLALAPGIFTFGATRAVGAHLIRLDRPMIISGITLAAMAGNVALCLLLIPRWGLVGCALASSAGYAVLGGAQVAWFLRATRTPARALVPGRAELDALRRAYRARRIRAASDPTGEPEAGGPRA
nr:polysaccharide biosynthesis C-terminal domain-containing protein [Planosporangium flavigriseum]